MRGNDLLHWCVDSVSWSTKTGWGDGGTDRALRLPRPVYGPGGGLGAAWRRGEGLGTHGEKYTVRFTVHSMGNSIGRMNRLEVGCLQG